MEPTVQGADRQVVIGLLGDICHFQDVHWAV